MIIRYEISLQKRKKKVRNHVCMFGVVERRKGDLSAQVGRRVMCVVQVSKKFPPPMMKGENSPSSPPDGRTLLGQFSPVIIDGADFAWTGLDRISYGRHASCVQVYGSQPTHSRVRQDICRRATDASVKVGFQHDMAGYCSNSSHVQVLGSRPTHSHDKKKTNKKKKLSITDFIERLASQHTNLSV